MRKTARDSWTYRNPANKSASKALVTLLKNPHFCLCATFYQWEQRGIASNPLAKFPRVAMAARSIKTVRASLVASLSLQFTWIGTGHQETSPGDVYGGPANKTHKHKICPLNDVLLATNLSCATSPIPAPAIGEHA